MNAKNTFSQVIASVRANQVEKESTSTLLQDSSKKDSLDMDRAKIEFLLAWAEQESLPGSLFNFKKINYG